MSKLVLIDGNNIIHRAYYALPSNLTTRSGEPINAIYGFVSMLLRIITDLKPTHIAIAFDREEPTFRKKKFNDYQIQRKPSDEELKSQFKKARDVAHAFNIPVFESAGFEADDLIGTITLKLERDVNEVVIVTGDKDMLQLVTKKTKAYFPVKGLNTAELLGEKQVEEKLNVKPSQIVDYKGLVGDPSDNYPGVAGIGPKTAVNLLEKYKTFDGVYKHLDQIPETISKKLEYGKVNGDLSFELAKIKRDVSVDVNLEKMNKWQVDRKEVLDLFSEYGFRTLTKRVKEVGKSIVSENQKSLF
jgi:DNA polymerase I